MPEYSTKTHLRIFVVACLLGIDEETARLRAKLGQFGPLVTLPGHWGRFLLRAELEKRLGTWTDAQVASAVRTIRARRRWQPKYSRTALEEICAAALKRRDEEWLLTSGSPPRLNIKNYIPAAPKPEQSPCRN